MSSYFIVDAKKNKEKMTLVCLSTTPARELDDGVGCIKYDKEEKFTPDLLKTIITFYNDKIAEEDEYIKKTEEYMKIVEEGLVNAQSVEMFDHYTEEWNTSKADIENHKTSYDFFYKKYYERLLHKFELLEDIMEENEDWTYEYYYA